MIEPDDLYQSQQRPFEEWRFLPLKDDIASTSFWYQTEPHTPFPTLPDCEYLEVI